MDIQDSLLDEDQTTSSNRQEPVIGYPVQWYSRGHDEPNGQRATHETQSHNNSNSNDNEQQQSSSMMLLARACMAFAVLELIGVVLYGCFYRKIIRQQDPLQFQVDSLRVSSMTNFHDNMTANVNVTLSVTNKQAGLYDSLIVSTEYRDEFLSSASLEPFYLDRGEHKAMQVGVRTVPVSNVSRDAIFNDMTKQRALELVVYIYGHYWSLKGENRDNCFIQVSCKGINLSPYNNHTTAKTWSWGMTAGSPIPCKFISHDCD